MKAWEQELEWISAAVPPRIQDDCIEDWLKYAVAGRQSDDKLFRDWLSWVPGSQAPCHLVVAAIQAMHNRGYQVDQAEALVPAGLEAAERKDAVTLQQLTGRIYHLLDSAVRDPGSPYWSFREYHSWEDIQEEVHFPQYPDYDASGAQFADRIRAGWMGQLIGGALGTQLEGFTTDNIRKAFGEVRGFLRKPETYNDDIVYELAFLEAFLARGYAVTSEDIAGQWLGLVPDGYSAEGVALENLRRGVFPPESGRRGNWFSDWIGAQMRTAIHGMAAPGNPKLAARLAVTDSVISHSNNGMIGGMFNAVLVSLCFVESDVRRIVDLAVAMMPARSEYAQVALAVLGHCRASRDWETAWSLCARQVQEYHWIHAYPNLAAEIVALWFGEGDFDRTAHIVAMAGFDVDCTAAPVLNALAVMGGTAVLPARWVDPIGSEIHTFMRKYQTLPFGELVEKTVLAVRQAKGPAHAS